MFFLCPPGVLYCAVRSYSTKKEDEVSVPIGSVVEVLQKSDDGWWLIRYLQSAKQTCRKHCRDMKERHVECGLRHEIKHLNTKKKGTGSISDFGKQ